MDRSLMEKLTMKKIVLAAFAASAILAACEQQGPAEEAGEEIDEAVGTEEQNPAEEAWEDTTDAAEDAWDATTDAAEDAGEQVEEWADEAGEAMEEATEENPEDGAPE
ncbi:MAG TPA: hypothetical protein DF715_06640 [Oceanicaulis sp.]|jgi:inactivated superfamily I helicase|nr:hypothetical protein [Oceanicaulis sp.]